MKLNALSKQHHKHNLEFDPSISYQWHLLLPPLLIGGSHGLLLGEQRHISIVGMYVGFYGCRPQGVQSGWSVHVFELIASTTCLASLPRLKRIHQFLYKDMLHCKITKMPGLPPVIGSRLPNRVRLLATIIFPWSSLTTTPTPNRNIPVCLYPPLGRGSSPPVALVFVHVRVCLGASFMN